MASKTPHVHAGSACPSPPIRRAHTGGCLGKEGAIPEADASKVGGPAACPGREGTPGAVSPPGHAPPGGMAPHQHGGTPPPRTPTSLGGCRPQTPSAEGGAPTHSVVSPPPPAADARTVFPARLRRGLPPHGLPERGPAPTLAVPPESRGRAAPARAPRRGAPSSPGPRVGRPIPPASAPEWNVPASPRGSRRPSGARAGPLGPGGGRPGGSTRGAGRDGGPGPLPAAAPLSEAQDASEVTAPASALSASSGTSSSMAARADRPAAAPELRPPPPNNNRRRPEGGGRGPGPGSGGRARRRGQRAPRRSARASNRGSGVVPRASPRLARPQAPGGGRAAACPQLNPVALILSQAIRMSEVCD